jgi:hypothetical protein
MKTRSLFVALLVVAGACSKDALPTTDTDRTAALCAKKDLQIYFSPMYSAFDGVHPYKIPAMVANVDPAAVTWSAQDAAMVDFETDLALGGVSIVVHKAGETVVLAQSEGKCGATVLKVTSATPDDWMIGSMRYNNGIKLVGDVGRGGTPMTDVACTNCHGDTATAGPYKTVAHTPQQTGGFSDEELMDIYTKGVIPVGGYFDDSFISYDRWRAFHKWQMTPQEAKGVLVYLRSLTPQSQKGTRGDFGGRGRRDGGMGDVGGGGAGTTPDVGTD